MNRSEKQAAISLASIYMLRMLGLFMVMPVLAVLAVDYPGYAPWLVGLAIGGYGLTQAILQIPMGILSDRLGRKPVIALGLLLFAIGSLIAGTADTMWMLVLGRIIQGAGAIAGAVMALAADVSREDQRPKVMAVIGVSIGLSFYLALVLGPVLVNFAGLSGLFYLTATLAVAGIFLVLYAVPDTQSKAPAGDTLPSQSNLAALLVDPHLMRLNLGVMLLHMLITVFFVAFPPVLIEVGIPLSKHWQSYLPVLCVSVLIMSLLMGLTPRLGQRRLIVVCLLMLSAAFAGMSWQANNLLILLLLACVFFGGFNYLEANFPAMVSQLAPAGMRGSAMGVYASFQFFGAFLGGLIAGISRQTGSDQLPLLIGSGICLGWLLFAPKSLTQDKGKVKRLTLAFQPQQPEAVIQQKLTSVLGIIEANIDQQQNVVYLKVNSNQFELAQAQRALQSE